MFPAFFDGGNMAGLEDAIENLYRAFASYPCPAEIDGCPCCVDAKVVKNTLHSELPKIPEDELWSYVFSVFYTVGDVADFKYFLPRVLEQLADVRGTAHDPEVVLCKLVYAGIDDWPEAEKAAVSAYLHAVFHEVLLTDFEDGPWCDGLETDSWLCGLSRCVTDIAPYIGRLDCPEFEHKKDNFLLANQVFLSGGKLADDWWYLSDKENVPYRKRLEDNRERVMLWLQKQTAPAVPQP